MTYNSNLSKIIKKSIEKNRQAFLNKKKAKPRLVQHGLFLFETGCTLQKSIESSRIERCKHEEQMLQLMHMYQEYHDIVSTRQYASRGSKLVCQYGTKPALLDTLMDHGVYAGTRPVMTCLDCRKENLHDFGSCMCPERLYKDRLPMTVAVHRNGSPAKRAPYNKYPHICVPLVDMQAGWHQAETGVLVEAAEGGAIQALLDEAFLVCQYGGIITIPEVPSQQNREKKKICVWCSKAVNEKESAYMENAEGFTDISDGYEFNRTNIAFEKCFGGCLSKKCVGEDCTVITYQQDKGDIEDGIWQEYDDVYHKNEEILVNSENTYMICTKGGGFIYFLEAKQELLDIAEQFKQIDIYVTSNQLRLLNWIKLTMDTVIGLNQILEKYEINTRERIRHFLAQCMKESGRGAAVREGETSKWKSQKEYEDYFNKRSYKYKYRGVGYIQMTHKYNYLAFATFLIKQEYPKLNIEWKSPANNNTEKLLDSYNEAVQKAEKEGYDVEKYKKIVDEGADYVAQEFAWETAGFFWKVGNLNTIVDGLTPGNKNEADKVTAVIQPNANEKSRENRRDYYEETTAVIK